eukprot:TRINITY_DN614_c1_g2_i1.p1 TRINITY_DN614_c1_g2~~TRINITY_DN614_c1_g2_i1.p1  ORF type:complete len:714 (+),score=84.18 TRINITY_DN614_c1_g2_i1:197-2143(+)
MAAGCFYITNTYNDFVGNAASGGWAGFAMPSLRYPVKLHYGQPLVPKNRPFKAPFRGNSAHSTGYWWATAAGIYVGGELQQNGPSDPLRYTSGRSATHDTCVNKLAGLPGESVGCYTAGEKMWLRFEDNKVFLANRGKQHWGERSEIIRFELHDVGLSMNVFGQVWIDKMLMECRGQNHKITWFNGCSGAPTEGRAPGWGVCNIRDFYHFYTFGGFQWYDVSQQHILTNSTFRNCENTWSRCVYGSQQGECDNIAVFTSLTHSDEFVPENMQITSNIKFQNVSQVWRYSTSLSAPEGLTVSGRLQNWYDADGTTTKLGGRAQIGSARANEWWKYNDDCILEDEAYKCRMAPRDGQASFILHYSDALESRIGGSACINGGKPNIKCPVVAKATHFGRDESLGLEIGINAKVTGPIIDQSGGWFLRFSDGTPSTLSIANIQVDSDQKLVLALPYPAGTTFNIVYQAASWCSTSWGVCQHNYRAVRNITAIRDSFGDTYFWDETQRTLYLRVVNSPSFFGGLPSTDPAVWSPYPPPESFSRNNHTIVTPTQASVVITATCPQMNNAASATATGSYCAPQTNVRVPAATAPYVITTSSARGSTTTSSPTNDGAVADGIPANLISSASSLYKSPMAMMMMINAMMGVTIAIVL